VHTTRLRSLAPHATRLRGERVEGRLHGPARRLRFELAATGASLPFRWMEEAGGTPRRARPGGARVEVRWVGLDPCYVFHVMNAFDEGDDVSSTSAATRRRSTSARAGRSGRSRRPSSAGGSAPTRTGPRSSAGRPPDRVPPHRRQPGRAPLSLRLLHELDHSNTIGAATGLVRYDLGRGEAKRYPSPSTSHPVNRSSCVPPMGGRRRGLGADGRLRRHRDASDLSSSMPRSSPDGPRQSSTSRPRALRLPRLVGGRRRLPLSGRSSSRCRRVPPLAS